MDSRTFDRLTQRLSTGTRRGSRRQLLKAVPLLAATALAPRVTRAFDAGNPIVPAGGGTQCAAGADCPGGQVCLNGFCRTLNQVAQGGGTEPSSASTGTGEPAAGSTSTSQTGSGSTSPNSAANATSTPEGGGIGGQISLTEPLAAQIHRGTCGKLTDPAAFQLIDIAPLGAGAQTTGQEPPVGSALAIPARYSTTVIDATLNELIAGDHAVDVRIEAGDEATTVVCGAIGGRLGGQISGTELAIGLREENGSGYGGIAWLRQDGERTVVEVFVAQGLDEGAAVSGLLAPETAPSLTATPRAVTPAEETPTPAATEAAATETAAPTATPEAAPTTAPGATPAASGTTSEAQAAGTPVAVADFREGELATTTTDVNLRAEPSQEAPVVTVLGTGQQLEVTGPPQGIWVPVRVPETDQRGFVSAEFLTPVVA